MLERERERERERVSRGRKREALFFVSRGETPRAPRCRLGWQAAGTLGPAIQKARVRVRQHASSFAANQASRWPNDRGSRPFCDRRCALSSVICTRARPNSENIEPEETMCKTDVRTNAAGDEATPFA